MPLLRIPVPVLALTLASSAFGASQVEPQLETVLSGAGWLRDARAVAVDGLGNAYVASGSAVVRIAPDGTRTTMIDASGNTESYLSNVIDLAADSEGNVYVAGREDFHPFNNVVFMVAPDGAITRFGLFLSYGFRPWQFAVDKIDKAYLLAWRDSGSTGERGYLYELSPDGTGKSTFLWGAIGAMGASAYPPRMAVDGAGSLYFANRRLHGSGSSTNFPIQRLDPDGTITEIHDLGFSHAVTLTVDDANNVYAVTATSRLDRITPAGDVTTTYLGGLIGAIVALDVDAAGNVYVVSDETDNVLLVAPDGTTTEIIGPVGDGSGHPLAEASDVALGPDGSVFVSGFASRNAFRVAPDGVVTEIVDETGDGSQVDLLGPGRMTAGTDGSVYVCGIDSDNVFRLAPTGEGMQLIEGAGDGSNQLDEPVDVAVDTTGNVFVVGLRSDNAFRIAPDGTVVEILSSSGDGTGNVLELPWGVAVDLVGNAYVTGYGSHNLFRIAPDGTIDTLVGDSGEGADRVFERPTDCAVDPLGNVWVRTAGVSAGVFRVDPVGVVTRVADAGETTNLAVGSSGNAYLSLSEGVVCVSPSGIVSQFGTNPFCVSSSRSAPSPGGDVFGSTWVRLNLGCFPERRSVFRVAVDGTLTEVLGIDHLGPKGNIGPTDAHPLELTVDPSGHLYLAHRFFHTVSRLATPCTQLPSATIRNAGTNPPSYTVTPASVGGTLHMTVNLATTGHSQALVLGFDSPFELTLAGGQTLLCLDLLGSGGELINTGFHPGPLAEIDLAVPNEPALAGFQLSTQALHAFGVVPFALSNAQDVVIGGCSP